MRRSDREITDRQTMDDLIRNAKIVRIGMISHGEPYVVPLFFGYEGDTVYFHSATEGRKVDALEENPRVCLEFEGDYRLVSAEKPCSWSAYYASIIAFGSARLLVDAQEKARALNCIMRHYDEDHVDYHFSDSELQNVKVYAVRFDEISGKARFPGR